jgi:hypothetical protein
MLSNFEEHLRRKYPSFVIEFFIFNFNLNFRFFFIEQIILYELFIIIK